MGFRFRKSFKVAPGIKLNFNKKSTGVTFGDKGLHYTVNSSGKSTMSAGIPGTGLYYTESSDKSYNGSYNNRRDSSSIPYNYNIANNAGNYNNYSGGNLSPQKNPNNNILRKILAAVVLFALIFVFIGIVDKALSNDSDSRDMSDTAIAVFDQYATDKITNKSAEAEVETETENQTEKATNKQPATERDETPAVKPTKPTEPATAKPTQAEITYVLSTDTKKYHLPSCRHVKKIKPENYQESKTVPSDYSPCGTCHPDRY